LVYWSAISSRISKYCR